MLAGAMTSSQPSPLVPELAQGIDDAGFAILRAAAHDGGNVVVSPVSIGLAFGMADAGASGRLADALARAFSLPAAGERRWTAFDAYRRRLVRAVGEEAPAVTIANRVFTDAAFTPRTDYAEVVERWFDAGAESVPMRQAPQDAAARIDAWVAERTGGLIRDLVSDASFDEASRLMLVNALAMRARWREPLDAAETTDEPFTLLDGTEVTAPLMDATATATGVAERPDCVAASLAYAGESLEMVVIVPHARRFTEVRDRLGAALLEELDASWLDIPFSVAIPRFEAASTVELSDVMECALGITDVFATPGLDRIAPDLVIDGALHAARVIVDEEGTEAAAATAIDIAVTGMPLRFLDVRADRPFLYVIRDVDTGAALFAGQVINPAL